MKGLKLRIALSQMEITHSLKCIDRIKQETKEHQYNLLVVYQDTLAFYEEQKERLTNDLNKLKTFNN